jgi:hypothetical protein
MTLTGHRASPDGRDADQTIRPRPDGTEHEMGLSAGHAPYARMRGRPLALPLDGADDPQSGGPLAAAAGHQGRPE